jgi:uncharacterized protein (TIGR02145 family)
MSPGVYFISTLQGYVPYVPTPIEIGGQIWDQKNLNESRFNDGTLIPQVVTGWASVDIFSGWRYYNNLKSNGDVYGRLYNYWVSLGIYDNASYEDSSLRKDIAPEGWRVSTDADWTTLSNYLGGDSVSGGKLKETGSLHWTVSSTSGSTNEVLFFALGGGLKGSTDSTTFLSLNNIGYWWTPDPTTVATTKNVRIDYNDNNLVRQVNSPDKRGQSIRLIKKDLTIPGFTSSIVGFTNAISATGSGEFTDLANTPTVSEKGICWGIGTSPNIVTDTTASLGSGTDTNPFSAVMSPLSASTNYYVRAYAKIAEGTAYAFPTSFTTLTGEPTSITTSAITNVNYTTLQTGGTIVDNIYYPTTARGVCFATSSNPVKGVGNFTLNSSGPGTYTSNVTNLKPGIKYYVKAYATNAAGTFYGNEVTESTVSAPEGDTIILGRTTARHAYSLRKLSDTYVGQCIRVRRTNTTKNGASNTDSVTVDVAFDSTGVLSLSSSISFISGTGTSTSTNCSNLGEFAAATNQSYSNPDNVNENQSVFVVTWHNQSNNNNTTNEKPTMAVLASQPRIVFTGSLETINNTAAIRFLGAQYLTVTNGTVPYTNMSFFVLGSGTTTNNINHYGLGHGTSNARLFMGRVGGIWYDTSTGTTVPDWALTSFTANTQRLYELAITSTSASAWSNGAVLPLSGSAVNTTMPAIAVNSTYIRIGANSLPLFFTNGTVQEILAITGSSDDDRTAIETNISQSYNLTW